MVEADVRAIGVTVAPVGVLEEQSVVPRPGLEIKLNAGIRMLLFLGVISYIVGATKK